MTHPPTNEPNDGEERPGLLGRIRPIAKLAFGVMALSAIVAFAFGLWHIAGDVWNGISGRR